MCRPYRQPAAQSRLDFRGRHSSNAVDQDVVIWSNPSAQAYEDHFVLYMAMERPDAHIKMHISNEWERLSSEQPVSWH